MAWIVIGTKKRISTGNKSVSVEFTTTGFTHSDQSIDFEIQWSANGTTNWIFNAGCFIPYSPEATYLEIETGLKGDGYFRARINIVDPHGTISFSGLVWRWQ